MRKQKESKQKKSMNRYLYKPGVLLFILGFLLSGSMTAQAAVTQEDLANPVVDKKSHNQDKEYGDSDLKHESQYHYVYFGNYPQREIAGEELTSDIINAAYDQYGNAEVNGKKYRRISYQFTTIYNSWNDGKRSRELFAERSTNGYRYYLYEPIKWRIYKNDGDKLFLVSDRLIESQIYHPSNKRNWADCDLRKWLNYDGGEPQVNIGYENLKLQYRYPGFYYYAFSEEEKDRIQVTEVVQDTNPFPLEDGSYASSGPDAQDKVFIPSYSEITNLDYGGCHNGDSGCLSHKYKNTDYARTLTTDDYRLNGRRDAYGQYWIRTCAVHYGVLSPLDVMTVSESGRIILNSVKADYVSVLPALNAGYTLNDCIRVSFETGTDTKIEDQILLGSNFAKEPMEVIEAEWYKADYTVEPKLQLKKDGYEFTGWYLDKDCKSPYQFNRKLTQDTTLYAGWKKKQNTPTGLTGGAMKIEGTTSAMEYASSKEGSAQWTPCKNGITVVPSAGTWYVRYKETKEYSASDAVEVKVITAEEAITKYIREHNIPKKTAAITDKTILGMSSDKDVPGASFRALCARATKVTAKTITLKWNPVKEADGYEIYGNKCGRKNKYRLLKTVPSKKTVSYKQKKLKKGIYYKYIVRAYKEIGGKKVSLAVSKTVHAVTTGGKYGNAKSVNVKTDKKLKKKKSTYTLKIKKNKKYSLKVSLKKPSKKMKSHRKTLYESSNTSIATITAKGVIKGKKKGSCYIYVYAQNGLYKRIKVNVK